jgi:hypothetical protein
LEEAVDLSSDRLLMNEYETHILTQQTVIYKILDRTVTYSDFNFLLISLRV